MTINSIAVFCGSNSGADPLYAEHAKQLGYLLAKKNIQLIYGGGNKGLMAAVANAVLEKQGKVIGIIPTLLTKWEHQHEDSLHHGTDLGVRRGQRPALRRCCRRGCQNGAARCSPCPCRSGRS